MFCRFSRHDGWNMRWKSRKCAYDWSFPGHFRERWILIIRRRTTWLGGRVSGRVVCVYMYLSASEDTRRRQRQEVSGVHICAHRCVYYAYIRKHGDLLHALDLPNVLTTMHAAHVSHHVLPVIWRTNRNWFCNNQSEPSFIHSEDQSEELLL